MKNYFYIYYLLLLVLFFNTPGSAKNDSYILKTLGIEDGLSQSAIHAILQDKEGYMWFATSNGLNIYDGYSFKVFTNNPYDSTSISDNGITSLYEDKQGNFWIGTTKGILNKYDRADGSFIHYNTRKVQSPIPAQDNEFYEYPIMFSRNDNNSITTIAEDNEGNLWLGTWGKGLLIFNKNNFQIRHYYYRSSNENGLSYNRIMKILIDESGTVWIGTFGGGLNKVAGSTSPSSNMDKKDELSFIHYMNKSEDKNSLSDNKIISLFEDGKKNLWIGTYNGGLNKLPANQKSLSPSQVSFIHYKKNSDEAKSIGNNSIMAILEDNRGNLWLGTFGGGLTRFNVQSNTFSHFLHEPLNKNSLAGNDVISLCEDASGIIWVGTHLGDGITKLEMSKVKFGVLQNEPANKNSLSDNVVWAIIKDNEHNLWIGTYRGGLNKYDLKKNKFSYYFHSSKDPYSLSDNHIRSLAQDKYGNFWIGTYSGGLDKFDPKTGRFISHIHDPKDPHSIGANQIQDIYIDSSSNVWLATFTGGLNVFKTTDNNNSKIDFKRFENDPSDSTSISDNRVYSLYEDRNEILWVGTFGGGLNAFDKKKKTFVRYENDPLDENSISDNRVISIYEDSRNNLWIGTYGGGLNRFNRETKKFIRYKNKNELNCDVVYGILEDNNTNLWLSTDNGIFRYNIVSNFITHYDLQDGVQSAEFSGGAYFKAEDGEMFFGGINGLNYFYPDSIESNSYIPKVVITSIKIFNNPVKGQRKNITLSYNENFISFEFSSLDYSNPEDNHYAYKLVGLENEWQYVNADFRMASYTNLSSGHYTFIVKGSNSDRIWNPVGNAIAITILPPFWRTWWFISLCIVGGGLIVYFLSTLRIKNLLAIERLKTKLAADLHDNIGAGLTEISILSELAVTRLNGSSEKKPDELKKISERARQLIDSMSDIIWVVNPKKDSLYDLIVRLKDSYSDFLESIGIRLKTSNLERLENIKLPMDYRQNLYLIFKEGINNCIKHSKCRNIFLEANVQGDIIEIKLHDDGIGILFNKESFGNGLFNMKSRAEMIGGKIEWEKNNGSGTVIHFWGKSGSINKVKNIITKQTI